MNKKIVIVPRKKNVENSNKHSKIHIDDQFLLKCLQMAPIEREEVHIKTLTSYFMEIPEFLKIAKNQREVREMTKILELEIFNQNTTLFHENGVYDGIYFILKGEVILYKEIDKDDQTVNQIHPPTVRNDRIRHIRFNLDNTNNSPIKTNQNRYEYQTSFDIPYLTHHLLEFCCGSGKNFEEIEIKKQNTIIGINTNEIHKQHPWTYTAVVSKPSYILRIDPSTYRKTVDLLRSEEVQERASFLRTIPLFRSMLYNPEIFVRLASEMRTVIIPKGTRRKYLQNNPEIENCWLVIKSGNVSKFRLVNFDNSSIDQRALFVGSIKIPLLKGVKNIKTDSYKSGDCTIDPSLCNSIDDSFELRFVEDTIIFAIDKNDVKDIIPNWIKKDIERTLFNHPPEQNLIRSWCEKEMEIQWHIFRHSCSKEAKNYVENERIRMTGEVECRKPFPPKQIKDHQLSTKSRRFRTIRKLKKTKEQDKPNPFFPSFTDDCS